MAWLWYQWWLRLLSLPSCCNKPYQLLIFQFMFQAYELVLLVSFAGGMSGTVSVPRIPLFDEGMSVSVLSCCCELPLLM